MPRDYIPPHAVKAYPFHERRADLPALFHLSCDVHPDFGACVAEDEMSHAIIAHLEAPDAE
jgi:hypothetical protein